MAEAKKERGPKDSKDLCFVIMPISKQDGYSADHFTHVYKNIIRPACEQADYSPYRADDGKGAGLIHLDILKNIVEAPMAICDLSSANPNVLFELGIRQAFDLPVVIIQEEKSRKIFDISIIKYIEYFREMRYHEVLETQKELADALLSTAKQKVDGSAINSIVRLLALREPASIPDVSDQREAIEFDRLNSEMRELKNVVLNLSKRIESHQYQSHQYKIGEREIPETERVYVDIDFSKSKSRALAAHLAHVDAKLAKLQAIQEHKPFDDELALKVVELQTERDALISKLKA